MPVSLSVKNVPDEVAARLRARARTNRRSMQGEILAILEEAVASKRLTVDDLRREVRALGFKTPDSVDIIREERDSR